MRLESPIDSAVACDEYMRHNVSGHLPATLRTTARKHVERANVRPTLVDMFADNLDDEQRARLSAVRVRLEALFTARNEILHRGHKKDPTQAACKDFLQVARGLLCS